MDIRVHLDLESQAKNKAAQQVQELYTTLFLLLDKSKSEMVIIPIKKLSPDGECSWRFLFTEVLKKQLVTILAAREELILKEKLESKLERFLTEDL
ncbi:MAG TPA: hypothetical protein VMW24_12625 [Sedimentisphaerales bacterium]|nr:hypothetical protein [Sedimentisphaerales bacterium]